MPIAAGTRLGRYEIRSSLGVGGMGEVYRAQDSQLGRDVALKILPAEFAGDPSRRQRFAQEARAVAALSHPNIVALHDIGVSGEVAYMITELVDGESLRAEMANGPMPMRRLLEIGIQIADGLSAAHAAGIVHRDLKPENIMLTRDGRVKILDFGLAKPTQRRTQEDETQAIVNTEPGMVMGTLSYMSPEQVRADKDLDGRSDQFSLGLIFYEMASGKKAFSRPTPAETMTAILKDDLEPLPAAVPPPVRWIVERCLAKDPHERYGSTRDLYLELRNLREHYSGSVTSQPGEATASQLRPAKRKRPVFPIILSFVFLAIVMTIAFIVGRYSVSTAQPTDHQLTFRRGNVNAARFSPDGHTIVYGAQWDGGAPQIFLKRLDSPDAALSAIPGTVFAIASTGEMLVSPTWKLQSGLIGWGTLARAPMLGGSPRVVLDDVLSADWSPDAQQIAVVRRFGNRIRVEYPIGKMLYDTSGWISDLRVSPKGERVAFIEHPINGDDRGYVEELDRNGKGSKLTPEWASVAGLAWSPRGEEIWFAAIPEGSDRDLYAVNLSQRIRVVWRTLGSLSLMDISPSGRVLLSHGSSREEMGVLSAADGKYRDLTWLGHSSPADISPDGSTLLFTEAASTEGSSYSVWIRKTDGAPPVRLGEGTAVALSPDGKFALSILLSTPRRLQLLPTGIGDHQTLPAATIISYQNAAFLPDGKSVIFTGIENGKGERIYTQSIGGGDPHPITAEGVHMAGPVSPDGKFVVAKGQDHQLSLYPVNGGDIRNIQGLDPGDTPAGWTADSGSLYMIQPGMPASVFKLNVSSGHRDPVTKIDPPDHPGISGGIYSFLITPDGKTSIYQVIRLESSLYLIDGLR